MLSFLPAPLAGAVAILLYAINLTASVIVIYVLYLLRLLFPTARSKRWLDDHTIYVMPSIWASINTLIIKLTSRTQFIVHLPPDLDLKQFYLVIANHQSWADIIILYSIFNRRVPMLKFFLKKELLWVPVLGQACWLYGFPFLYRFTKSQIQKHPELKGRDAEITRQACQRFRERPGCVTIFPEGTRFTPKKHQVQHSPYRHLLKPKAGGIALALQSLNGLISTVLDVTIVYPPQENSFWRFCCGKTEKIIVQARALPVTTEMQGNYETNTHFRSQFQQWLNKIWFEKDQTISTYGKDFR